MSIENIKYIIRFLQNKLYNLKKRSIKKRYNSVIVFILSDKYIINTEKSKRPSISLNK